MIYVLHNARISVHGNVSGRSWTRFSCENNRSMSDKLVFVTFGPGPPWARVQKSLALMRVHTVSQRPSQPDPGCRGSPKHIQVLDEQLIKPQR